MVETRDCTDFKSPNPGPAAGPFKGPGLATPCPTLASSPGRSIQRPQFSGSKAGVTFCLAMISISNGLKTRASQRHRNNCLTVGMEKGTGNFPG